MEIQPEFQLKFIGWDFLGFWNCFPWLKKRLPEILDPSRGNKSILPWDQKSLCRTTAFQKTQHLEMNFCMYRPYHISLGLLPEISKFLGSKSLSWNGRRRRWRSRWHHSLVWCTKLHQRQQMSSTGWSTGVYTNRFRLIGIQHQT